MKRVYPIFLYHSVYLSSILCYYMCVCDLSHFCVVLCPSSRHILATPLGTWLVSCVLNQKNGSRWMIEVRPTVLPRPDALDSAAASGFGQARRNVFVSGGKR